jgi:tRNA (guanine-N1)-methyltransferase
MVNKPGPVVEAMEHVARERGPFHRVLLTPSAPRFDQRAAARLARLPRIGLLCGRYEGIDDRVREHFVDECLSLGDFVLGGGEVGALVIIEAVARLLEGVVGNPESVHADSFGRSGEASLLEHPHYTRPAEFRGHAVPTVLLGGDHAVIARWRHASALRRTWALRPDLRPRPSLPPGHPLYLAASAAALADADALAQVARLHGAAGLLVVGNIDALDDWLRVWRPPSRRPRPCSTSSPASAVLRSVPWCCGSTHGQPRRACPSTRSTRQRTPLRSPTRSPTFPGPVRGRPPWPMPR